MYRARIHWLVFLYLGLLTPTVSWGDFLFPPIEKGGDKVKSMEVFGLGTAAKFLGYSHPLGGYSGLEISTSVETLNSTSLDDSGNKETALIHYPKITIGKGLFGDGDLFFNFIPFNQVTRFSRYGLQYRQSLYQLTSIPLNFSLLAHGNSTNIEDKLVTRTLGFDLVTSILYHQFSFAIGLGYATSTGDFSAKILGPNVTPRQSIDSLHLSASILHKPGRFIWGVGVDRYRSFVFSLKVGIIL